MIVLPLILMMQGAMVQPGANPRPLTESELPIPRARKAAPPPRAPTGPAPTVEQDRAALCLAKVRSDPPGAAKDAQDWLAESRSAKPLQAPRLCLGMAQAALLQWEAAEQTFSGLALEVPVEGGGETAVAYRAMAGTAAIAGGFPERALPWLDQAVAGAASIAPAQLGEIQIDRARALVALDKPAKARTALNEAHRLSPDDPDGWLLSATLYRRARDLTAAQADIEKAAALSATDPAIGLEAGVIAMLGGREAAARKSWDSVIALAPASNEARIAKGYLEQISPTAAATAPAQAPGKP